MEMKDNLRTSHALFALGEVTMTPAALAILIALETDFLSFLVQHRAGDWGEAEEGYAVVNDEALRDGGDVISLFDLGQGIRLRVTTEIRASTRVSLDKER
jgi:hypothetical protein